MTKTIIFIFLVFLAAGILHVRPSFQRDLNPILVVIPPGASVRGIAQLLREKKVLHSPLFFRILVYLTGSSNKLRQGAYILERNLS
ncbi:MAG: hypothetical protein HYY63_04330 [Elusimicrobia bacterium]|nr:hypothetical protein [Elusimicrobiota bacterium]